MTSILCERLIGQWCEATGMAAWPACDAMHVEIAGATVGLFFADDLRDARLHAYFDLGAMDAPGLHQRLLRLNLSLDAPFGGHYALHPDDSVVYRAGFALDGSLDGARLPGLLGECLQQARQRLLA